MFLKTISKILNKKKIVFVSRCTTGIFLTLKSLQIKNKRIIIPANICSEVVLSIIYSKNIPCPVDINNNLGISFSKIKREIYNSKNIGEVIIPYLYGNSDNFLKIFKFLKKKNILIIEDISGALGAKVGKKYLGSFSNICVGSFGQGKIIDMNGGGFVATNINELSEKISAEQKVLPIFNSKVKSVNKNFHNIVNLILQKKWKKKNLTKSYLIKFKLGFIYKRTFSKKYFYRLSKNISQLNKINYERNVKANYFHKIIKCKFLKSIVHSKGSVYWRKNFISKYNSKNLLSMLQKNNIYARNYYPSLDQIFPFFKSPLLKSNEKYKKIINFWVGKETSSAEIKKINKLIINYYAAY
jgi:dTDP-4-amino-4,6-dideoxygalactose transaminase